MEEKSESKPPHTSQLDNTPGLPEAWRRFLEAVRKQFQQDTGQKE